MASVDDLPADQRAALQLILKQGRTYDQIAELLRLEPRAVRERARSAVDALGPEDPEGLDLARQDEVADYLLGQQSAAERADTRSFLESSAPARAWARVVSGELRASGLAGPDDLPEVPGEGSATVPVEEPAGALAAGGGGPGTGAGAGGGAAGQRSSRLGGLVLLGVLALILAGAVLLATGAFSGSDSSDTGADGSTPTTGTTGTTAATGTGTNANPVLGQVNMKRGPGAGGANGVVLIIRSNGQSALGLQADKLAPATKQGFYAFYYTGQGVKPRRLGYPKTQPTQQSPRIAQLLPLPPNAKYDTLLLTRESDGKKAKDAPPGEVVLSASLADIARVAASAGAGAGAGGTSGSGGGG